MRIQIKMREFSCNCAMCLLTEFTLCAKDMHCNEWQSVGYDKTYQSYEVMRLRTDNFAVTSDSNHNM